MSNSDFNHENYKSTKKVNKIVDYIINDSSNDITSNKKAILQIVIDKTFKLKELSRVHKHELKLKRYELFNNVFKYLIVLGFILYLFKSVYNQ